MQECGIEETQVWIPILVNECIHNMKGLIVWVNEWWNRNKKRKNNSDPFLPKNSGFWFDAQCLKFMFLTELPDVVDMSVLYMDPKQPKNESFGFLQSRGDRFGLLDFDYDEIVRYVVQCSNLFVFDGGHFFPQAARTYVQMEFELEVLEEAIKNLATHHIESCLKFRLFQSFQFIERNTLYTNDMKVFVNDCKQYVANTHGREQPCKCYGLEVQQCRIVNDPYAQVEMRCINRRNRLDCNTANCSISKPNHFCKNRLTDVDREKKKIDIQNVLFSIRYEDSLRDYRALSNIDFAVGDYLFEYCGQVSKYQKDIQPYRNSILPMFKVNDYCWVVDASMYGNLSR
jgi:hypothetical protein